MSDQSNSKLPRRKTTNNFSVWNLYRAVTVYLLIVLRMKKNKFLMCKMRQGLDIVLHAC